jgi:four helix bundle protein
MKPVKHGRKRSQAQEERLCSRRYPALCCVAELTETQILGRQLLRSGTSVGAQYREATRAKSNLDFISKIEGSLQELEETEYWLELLAEAGFCPEEALSSVKRETGELKGIFVSIVRNTKAKFKVPKP